MLDRRDRARNLACHKRLTPGRTFVIEQNAVAGVEAIAFAVVYRCPVGENFRDAIRAARPEWCLFRLGDFLRLTVHLAARSLVKTRANSGFANRFQNADRSNTG